MLKRTIFGLAVGWTLLIAVLCLVKFTDLPSLGVSGADKYVHFIFHFGFTLFWGFYAWLVLGQKTIAKIVRVVVISFFYGILIEILQETCTSTRHADIYDVLANLSGAIFALILFVLTKNKKHTANR